MFGRNQARLRRFIGYYRTRLRLREEKKEAWVSSSQLPWSDLKLHLATPGKFIPTCFLIQWCEIYLTQALNVYHTRIHIFFLLPRKAIIHRGCLQPPRCRHRIACHHGFVMPHANIRHRAVCDGTVDSFRQRNALTGPHTGASRGCPSTLVASVVDLECYALDSSKKKRNNRREFLHGGHRKN